MDDADDDGAVDEERVSSFVERSMSKGALFLQIMLTALATVADRNRINLEALESIADEKAAASRAASRQSTGGKSAQSAGEEGESSSESGGKDGLGGSGDSGDEHSSTNCAHCAQVPHRTPAGTDRCCWTNTSQMKEWLDETCVTDFWVLKLVKRLSKLPEYRTPTTAGECTARQHRVVLYFIIL